MERKFTYITMFLLTLGCEKYEAALTTSSVSAEGFIDLPLEVNSSPQALTTASVSGGSTIYVCASGSVCGSGWKTGSNSNTKTQAKSRLTPFKTIDYAFKQAVAGDLIVVGSGVYSTLSAGDKYSNLVINKSGTSTKRISIKSEKNGVRFSMGAEDIV